MFELIKQIAAVGQMVCRVDLESGKGLAGVGRTEYGETRSGMREVVPGPVPDSAEAGLVERRTPTAESTHSPWW